MKFCLLQIGKSALSASIISGDYAIQCPFFAAGTICGSKDFLKMLDFMP